MKNVVYTKLICYLLASAFISNKFVSGNVHIATDDNWRTKRQVTYLPEYTSPSIKTNSQLKQINQDDNHKPMFDNCANYKPELKEEQPRGTHVIQVQAVDNDPKDAGGTVTYRTVKRDGDRNYFTIDSKTGEIVTHMVFDRDEPVRQKELYLTVQATDNGRPPLADVCTFKVTIIDINDNAPVFGKQIYKDQVSEDLKVNGEVMIVFAYDYDHGENSRLTYSFKSSAQGSREFEEYFRIDNATGVIYLKQQLKQKTNTIFTTQVVVRDNGEGQLHSIADIRLNVVSSDKQPPKFIKYPQEPIYLKENFRDFEFVLANLEAVSNINHTSLQFELVKGKTKQTNKDQTFQLSQKGNTEANITLSRVLDFETVTEYHLTVHVINEDALAASVTFLVKVEDVNDEIPTFIELLTGSVVENDNIGAQAMQVRAVDKDGTSANNIVSYELLDHLDLFEINNSTGIIVAKTSFDREVEDVYHVTVKAYDNSPSAIKKKIEPNFVTQKFRISIEDRNDNKPLFIKHNHIIGNISESSDKGKVVIEVKAVDKDTASLIKYSIIDGNVGDAFAIEETTGRITVNGQLDFEKIESYNLTVRAFDGIYEDTAKVLIKIQNENDEPPIFDLYDKEIFIEEEAIIDGCIIKLTAYDPDIKHRDVNQRIVYRVADEHKNFLNVEDENGSGCVLLIKKLDRDKPNGFPKYQAYIYAFDNDGGPNSLKSFAEINIILKDINDNAPFLNITEVVWYENQSSGDIVTLTADDYDSTDNGPPFTYDLADEASSTVRDKFSVNGDVLRAEVTFDRELQKYYDVPIAVTDNGKPRLTGISILRVIIGDVNDNPAKSGSSSIFVYNYDGKSPDVQIGRVYVDDPDDWDLPDKYFQWDGYPSTYFELDRDIGMITMKQGTPEGEHELKFLVTEEAPPIIPKHEVNATVIVTVKVIPKEAVLKSGSIRVDGTSIEDFVTESPQTLMNKKDILQERLAEILNTSKENVDVFTVLPTPNNKSFVEIHTIADDNWRTKRQVTYLPEYTSPSIKTNSQLKQINQDDNHKPMFDNCANYKPELKEEQPRGTHVIQVQAVDNDPKDAGGTVTYRTVKRDGDRDYFTIDSKTGEIVTHMVFDRDEPGRQKELYLTVQATDNGRPPLADVCTFKVTLIDINDNAPVFDKQIYKDQVSEDLKVNGEVMIVFAYDYDHGENSRLTYSFKSSAQGSREFEEYFRIDNATGVIYLKQQLKQKTNTIFTTQVVVRDNGEGQLHSIADIRLNVVSSDKQPPKFIKYPQEPIYLKENFRDFEFVLANLEAVSNINHTSLQFELVKGKTKQTNKDQTFQLSQKGNTEANITLSRVLDFETITEYHLTVRVTNKDALAASVTFLVKVEDVNDEIPTFIELLTGSVVENDNIGAQAMQVRAVDKDGTSANNIVSYELLDHLDLFEINNSTGIIVAKTSFDREVEDVYHVTVKAYDNSPSAIKKKIEPNFVIQKFRISIEDRNDNKPLFIKHNHIIDNISESSDKGKVVIEVKAVDKDTASLIKYSIIDGNVGDAFAIEETTGRITVNGQLDFEKIESYNLTVRAFDGIYEDTAKVLIKIQNENDEPPIFDLYDKEIFIEEEAIIDGCIIKLTAYDPDIKHRDVNQRIVYRVADEHKNFLNVEDENGSGCVLLIKKLDRDKPNGFPKYQAYIYAFDNDGGPNSLKSFAEINIILKDINDNAPFLNITEVVWYENQSSGDIVTLTADDYDSTDNGPPFTYDLADEASSTIRDKFSVNGDVLRAEVTFDRELQKYYDVPIAVTDNGKPRLTGISILRVIIGDVNDNPAKSGSSSIFVYNYDGKSPDVQIGRVYVDDPDDWDLPDKYFQWDGYPSTYFELDRDIGMITMKQGTPEGEHELKFLVTEEAPPIIPKHEVNATVIVTVKVIPKEAVLKSGSIRVDGTSIEDFVTESPQTLMNKKDILQERLAEILNTSKENVDVFTVLPTPNNKSLVDVRFSAHGSPYYLPEKLNTKASEHQDKLEGELGIKFVMISISECLLESSCPPQHSCSNKLTIKDEPAVVFTNKTSFVGVKAIVEAVCDCLVPITIECFNGGTPLESGICSCPEGFEGPHCEILAIAFHGDGYAMYPSFEACNNSEVRLEITTHDDGLIFYTGPLSNNPEPFVSDFMSLELIDGYPVLLLDYGTGTRRIELQHKKLNDGKEHRIRILYSPKEIQISVDDCHQSACQKLGEPAGPNSLLNVNGPLQLGGIKNDIKEISALLNWNYVPTTKGFYGCIRNLTFNDYIYNLGGPGEFKNAQPNCDYTQTAAVSFGIDSNFLVAILVCVAILLILLLAVVVHKRKQDNWNEKDMDDTRENIINYEDEGGGEFDTQFDMNVLRREEKLPIKENLYKQGTEVPADISRFLDSKKDSCDRDPDNVPYDDVRYYAYEGDGNSTGSLSSLASCTDEGDLKFNYLSNFGPRFRKLADMYGEDPSDDDSQEGGEESWC